MEHRYAVNQATGEFVYGGVAPYDCATGLSPGQIRVVLDRQPDKRLERYSGTPASPFRAATSQELADYDAAIETAEHGAAFDSIRILKALALVVADIANKTPAQMKALVIAKYKTLG